MPIKDTMSRMQIASLAVLVATLCHQPVHASTWEAIDGYAQVMQGKDTDYIWRHLEINLANGTILVRTTHKPVVVRTSRSTIKLASNSLASVYDNDGTEDTFIIFGKADIEVSGIHKPVSAGHESAVLRREAKVLPNADVIRRRNVKRTQLLDSKWRVSAEFSTADLLKTSPLFQQLAASRLPSDKALIRRVTQRARSDVRY